MTEPQCTHFAGSAHASPAAIGHPCFARLAHGMRRVQPHLDVPASHYETNTLGTRVFGPPAVLDHVINTEGLAPASGAAAQDVDSPTLRDCVWPACPFSK